VLRDGPITSTEPHVADLPLAEIFKHSVGSVTVGVPVLKSFFACNYDDQRMLCGRYDTTLLLPTKARVDISAPIVDAANLKTPAHRFPSGWDCRMPPGHASALTIARQHETASERSSFSRILLSVIGSMQ
jgi:hypothetical protein